MNCFGEESYDVYALCEPETGEIRYIGYSRDAHHRLRKHLRDRANNYRCKWIRELVSRGLSPRLKVLCIVQGQLEAKRIEVELIAAYRRRGARLTNLTNGGDGFSGLVFSPEHRAKIGLASSNRSPETLAKISAASKNRVVSAETREKIKRLHTGKVRPPATGKRISAALKGRKLTPEHCARISAAKMNPSAETRVKLSAARKGKRHSPEAIARIRAAAQNPSEEARAKMRAAATGRVLTLEERAKISAAHKGRKRSAEARANMSAAHLGKKLSPESIAKRTATRALRRRQQ